MGAERCGRYISFELLLLTSSFCPCPYTGTSSVQHLCTGSVTVLVLYTGSTPVTVPCTVYDSAKALNAVRLAVIKVMAAPQSNSRFICFLLETY